MKIYHLKVKILGGGCNSFRLFRHFRQLVVHKNLLKIRIAYLICFLTSFYLICFQERSQRGPREPGLYPIKMLFQDFKLNFS